VRPLDDRPSALALACERAFQEALDGSCRSPIAGLALLSGNTLSFRGEVIAPDGSGTAATAFRLELGEDARNEAAGAGRQAGTALKPRAAPWLAV